MSDKASGNGTEGRRDDDQELESTNTPEGEELSIDPESGDQLDLTDRWWDDSDSEEREGKGNRKVTPEERAAAEAEKAKAAEEAEEAAEKKKESNEDSEEKAEDIEEAGAEQADELAEQREDEDSGEESESEGSDESEGEPEETEKDSEEELKEEEGPVDVGALIKKPEPVDGLDEILGEKEDEEDSEDSDEEESSKEPMPWEKEDEDEEPSSEEDSSDDKEVESQEDDESAKENAESSEDKAKVKDEPNKKAAPALKVPQPAKTKKADEKPAEETEETEETEATDQKPEKSSGEKKKDKETLKVDLKDVATLKVEPEEKDKGKEDKDESPDLGLGEVIANPPPVQRVEAPKKKKAGCWTVFATLFFILTLLVLLAVAVVGYIGWTKLGVLESEITMKAQAELEKRGIYVDYEGWEYQFPRGLVLKGVTLFQSEARQVPQVKLSDLGINIDIIGLIKDRTSVDAAEISFQDSTLSFFQDGNPVAQIEEIDAEVLASPDKVDLERFDGRFGGLLVRASGDVAIPASDSAGGEGAAVASESEAFVLPLDFAMMEKIRPWLDVQANGKPPVLDVKFSSDGSAESLVLGGSLNGSDFVWHGVPLKRASATFSYDAPDNSLDVYSFQIGHGEGTLSGGASLNLDSKVLELENTESNVDLIALLSSFDAGMADKLKSVAVRDAPVIELSGSIPLEDLVNSEIEVSYDHLLGIVYTKDSRELPVSRIKSSIKLSGGVLTVEDTTGRLLDGDLAVGVTVRLAADNYPFSVSTFTLTGLPLSLVAKYFEMDSLGIDGDVDFEFRGSGSADLANVRGGGSILIKEAKLTAFPVIGKIQNFLGKVIPAFGVRKGDALSGSYIVESGILLTNDLTITQVGATVVVNGSVKLKPQTTEFTATASMDPTVITGTVLEGKQIVITGEGPLKEPEIKLKNFPVEFAAEELSSMLGTSPETLDQLKGLIEGEEDVAKMISEQLQEVVGDENATPEIQGLINGILGNMPPLNPVPVEEGEASATEAPETPETPEAPVVPEAAPETPAPPAAVPFRATPVEE
ncbi:MAG: hypothetical protein HRU46_01070 [Verrucomicrobiales bacterium]|nr:hypothetical protein [Verrucomicrobiales bacterium]